MSEEIPLTLSKLLNDYDTLIKVLNDRLKNPEKSGILSPFGKGSPSQAKESDAARYKQCVIGFGAPLLHALEIRTNSVALKRVNEEESQQSATLLNIDYGKVSDHSKKTLENAVQLRKYLRSSEGGQNPFIPTPNERGKVTPSKYSDIRVKYVDYMTRALNGLMNPATPCTSFIRLKNLIDDTTTKETGLKIRELIAEGEKVMANSKKVDTKDEEAEAEKVAAAATEGKPFGGRKRRTRRKRNIRRRKTTTRRCW
jgi:hypothetical protein